MGTKWTTTKYPGVRYREHPSRKFKGKPDRYYTIRYNISKGQRKEERLGWRSEGMTPEKAANIRGEILESIRTGKGAHTLKECQELAAEEKAITNIGTIQFGELWLRYFEWAKANKKHWADDERRYRLHLAPTLDGLPAKEVNPYRLEKLKQELLTTQRPGTTRHCLAIVRQIINRATEGLLGNEPFALLWPKGNPTAKIKMPRTDNEKERVLSLKEENLLFPRLLEKSWNTYCFALVSLYAGLRFDEVAMLQWLHIDMITWNINLTEGKGGLKRRVLIPLHPKLQRMFNEHKLKSDCVIPSGLVFPNKRGQACRKISSTYPRTVKELKLNEDFFNRHTERIKYDRKWNLDFHTLRHTFATRLASLNTPLPLLRDLLGHRTLAMVSRYAKSQNNQAGQFISEIDTSPHA